MIFPNIPIAFRGLGFAALDSLLDGSKRCLVEILFGLALGFALWGFLYWFLWHGAIMAGWRGESRAKKFKLHHYRIFNRCCLGEARMVKRPGWIG